MLLTSPQQFCQSRYQINNHTILIIMQIYHLTRYSVLNGIDLIFISNFIYKNFPRENNNCGENSFDSPGLGKKSPKPFKTQ